MKKRRYLYPRKPSLEAGIRSSHLLLGWEPVDRPGIRPIGFGPPRNADSRPVRQGLNAVWLENPESHGLCVAPTGSGKGRNSLIPHLLTWQGSAVVIDPKGEAAVTTGHYRSRVLGQRVIYLDPFQLATPTPDSLNPLDVIRFSDSSPEEFALTVPGLLHPDFNGSTRDPFWDNNGDSLLSGLVCHMLVSGAAEDRHFPKLRDYLMCDDVHYNLAVLLDTMGKKMPPMAYGNLSSFVSTVEQTRSGILATAQQHLRILADPAVVHGLKTTTFDLDAFKRGEPMTLYLILPVTRLQSHGILLRNWLSALFQIAMSRQVLPERSTLFFVDEVGSLGPMEQLRTAFTVMRGYGVRVFIYLQDLSQLKRMFPQDWETVVNNAGMIQTFNLSNHLMARQMGELFGSDLRPEDLLNLGPDEQIILFHGGRWKRCLKADYLTDPLFKDRFQANPRYGSRNAPSSTSGLRPI
ncbi:MAG: type IV secretory system conjugative DNA transfer family protein [Verrucomicrobia bacterium]|nr:type IV secretory system conjugative DNA transfer family protein [Verrucomicrobiota bacterium]